MPGHQAQSGEPVDYPGPDETPRLRDVPAAMYPPAHVSSAYPPSAPGIGPKPPAAPTAAAPGGGAAIAAGVLALVIGLYRAWETYLYFTVVAMFGGVAGEYSSYTRGPQTYATVAAIVSAIGAVALFVGAVMLFNRRLGGRGLITLGCLIAIADVVVTWIVVFQFMKGVSSFTSSLVGGYGGSSTDSIFSAAMRQELPAIVINIALSVGLPLLTMILARSRSTRRWCEASGTGVPPTGQPAQSNGPTPNDQTWQRDYTTPVSDGRPIPPSAPVSGWGGPGRPAHTDPHAEYYRQAADHFGAKYASRSPASDGENVVTRLLDRGMRGELIQQPWFQKFRAESPDQFVYISYGGGLFVSIVLTLIPSMFVSTVLSDLLWLAIGYLYLALGTKLAHQFLVFGICLVGTLVMLWRSLSAVTTVAINNSLSLLMGISVDPTALLLLDLLMNLAGAAFLVYVGLQLHRKMQQLS